ncbi:histidinol-phosphate transaminase [Ferruginivarius sediminum]|uniref:Histidinol-phosphate aminotransferase n=1 Tax=Ferruginivarius sediminum TaxID=2661937 RepID=A0A369T9B1_9PROT|nr:histidinol-phosphate transaminase [Ferruginivarius sediminum]RDD61903.1 histidinol-phosphate transaminase [Ferruginivarius sediminum]
MAPNPRPGILDIAPYVGGESELAGFDYVARLASNENPLGPSPKAAQSYAALKDDLHRYPDGGTTELRDAIAKVHDLDAGRIVCGAGSDELISLLVRAYAGPGDEVVYSRHGFLMYPIAATTAGAKAVAAPETDLTADVDRILECVGEATRMVFVANPNNPTGTFLPEGELERLHAGLPDGVLLVIDAAYAEYVEDGAYADGRALVERADNVVMTRTFSKIYGLAALRLGWAYGPANVVDVLNRLRGPFNVSAAAQAAGVAAVRDRDYVQKSVEHNRVWRDWFRQQAGIAGVEALPSVGNFVLLRFDGDARAEAAVAHFKENGVLVRRMASYGLPDCLRVSIGTETDMRMAADALASFAERRT